MKVDYVVQGADDKIMEIAKGVDLETAVEHMRALFDYPKTARVIIAFLKSTGT